MPRAYFGPIAKIARKHAAIGAGAHLERHVVALAAWAGYTAADIAAKLKLTPPPAGFAEYVDALHDAAGLLGDDALPTREEAVAKFIELIAYWLGDRKFVEQRRAFVGAIAPPSGPVEFSEAADTAACLLALDAPTANCAALAARTRVFSSEAVLAILGVWGQVAPRTFRTGAQRLIRAAIGFRGVQPSDIGAMIGAWLFKAFDANSAKRIIQRARERLRLTTDGGEANG